MLTFPFTLFSGEIFKNEFSIIFDGVNDYVDCGQAANFERTNTFSYELYFKTTGSLGNILGKQLNGSPFSGTMVQMSSNGSLAFQLISNFGSSEILIKTISTGFSDGNWQHCVVSYNGSSLASGVNVYINGALESHSVTSDNLTTTTINAAPFTMSSRGGGAIFFDGSVDEVVIYDKELSQSEVTERYNLGIPINAKASSVGNNILNYWRCGDKNTGDLIIPDQKGNNDGTLVNGATIQSDVP